MIASVLESAQLVLVHAAAAPALPTPGPEFNEDTVTPGLFGFVTMLVIAIAALLLAVDMVRRVRRTTYRAQITERLDAEQAQERDSSER